MRASLFLLAATALVAAEPNRLTPKEAAEGWILLFDGESTFGWTAEGKAQWRVADGTLIADAGDYGWLRSNAPFANYILKCEYRTAAEGNSGIFLRSARDGQPHVTGYELQIYDKHEKFPTGSILNHGVAKKARIKGGEWQEYEITADGDRFLVQLDGKKVLDIRDTKSAAGHIGLQYNKDKKVEFRNIKLKPLGLKPIFNGKDLSGWRKVEPPKPPKEPAEWSVKDGMLHVVKGGGQIETEGQYANFVLQMDIRTNPKDANHHPNSGVFFRGTPGSYWSGYESQIRNEYSDNDPTKPVDWGTGAIYRNQATRRIVAKDGEFFTKTLVAAGRVFSVWINGYPVTSWEDPNPEGTNVRQKQAVLGKGTISLQAHDPTTNLDFRNIRIAELPPAK